MKAAFLKAPFQVEYRDLEDPIPGFQEVLLRPRFVGVCGNDIQYARGLAKDWIRFGHEPACEVVAVGPGVEDLAPGDLVACQCSSACGYCRDCLMGRVADCQKRYATRALDYFSEYVVVNRRNMWPLDGVPVKSAMLLEPMGMAFDLVRLAEVRLDSTIALVGPGPIGLMAIRVAKLRGARRVYVVGVDADAPRFPLCLELGADECINASRDDPVNAILELTAGRAVDAVMNTATVKTIQASLQMCGFGGIVVFVGESTAEGEGARPKPNQLGPGAVPIDVNWVHLNRLQLRGSMATPNGLLPLGHQLLKDGEFPVEKLITHVFPFDQIERALHCVADREDGVVKAAIQVNP